MEIPKRYTDKRQYERQRQGYQKHEEKPINRSGELQIRIPVRIDHKTVVFVREKNLHKYSHLFIDEKHFKEHVARFKAGPGKFFY